MCSQRFVFASAAAAPIKSRAMPITLFHVIAISLRRPSGAATQENERQAAEVSSPRWKTSPRALVLRRCGGKLDASGAAGAWQWGGRYAAGLPSGGDRPGLRAAVGGGRCGRSAGTHGGGEDSGRPGREPVAGEQRVEPPVHAGESRRGGRGAVPADGLRG